MKLEEWLDYSEEVTEALHSSKPIVVLESTIISHGMPYPHNVETARSVEAIIRNQNAVPATIGIVKGKIKIGLSADELQLFAQSDDILKVSRRDLPLILSQKQNGATTVAATMICAKLAGIPVFVTGGMGGVHRDSNTTMDISADLFELSQTNVAVVCAGVKSILDIPKTLEYLETHGVPVIGYQTNNFPAFYIRESGCQASASLDSPEAIARFMKVKWELGVNGGLVIGVPVPQDEAMPEAVIENAIEQSLKEASQKKIIGKDITPYLLDRIKELTKGESLKTNIALVQNNALIGAQIAVAYHQLNTEGRPIDSHS